MTPYRWQLVALFGCVAAFFALMLVASPEDGFVYIVATLGFVAAPLLARRLGMVSVVRREEPLVLMLVSFLGVSMAAAWHFPIELLQWPAIALAALVIQGLWAIHRFEELPPAPRKLPERLRSYVTVGLFMALGFSLLATLILVFGGKGETDPFPARLLGLIILGYFVGALLASTLLAVTVPLTRWPLGTILVGILCGAMVYGAAAPAISALKVLEGEAPMSLLEMAGIALGCGSLAGPAAGLWFKYQEEF